MGLSFYAEMQSESQSDARKREADLIQRSIDMLERACASGIRSFAMVEAVHFTSRLWTALLTDLAERDNGLPAELKASLISIGIWVLRQAEAIRSGESENVNGIIGIQAIVRDGLK